MFGASSAAHDPQDDAGLAGDLARLYLTSPTFDNVGAEEHKPDKASRPSNKEKWPGRMQHWRRKIARRRTNNRQPPHIFFHRASSQLEESRIKNGVRTRIKDLEGSRF
eukprot:GHVS01001622.1.p2 GENE.GHVS01001622.1~~GHVS01001622.1.p2  ORF type:complete len:108 (+),score=12.33 GHVS01001622.1:135-458(+)